MRITLLDNGTGVIMTRRPFLADSGFNIEFENAPDGTVALFEVGSRKIFRDIKEGVTEIPIEALDGAVGVSVHKKNGGAWVCEGIYADKQGEGKIFVSPDDMLLPLEVAKIKVENSEIRARLTAIEAVVKANSVELATVKQALKELVLLMKNNTQI